MKKTFKYAYVALAGLLAMTMASCVDKYEYDGVGKQDPGAFISAAATQIKYAAEDEQILTFNLQRTNSEAAENISLTCDNSKFQVPASVSFAAGESKKTVSVPFSILGGTTEEVTISVAAESATVYGVSELKFTITRDFVWEYLGEGKAGHSLYIVVRALSSTSFLAALQRVTTLSSNSLRMDSIWLRLLQSRRLVIFTQVMV